MKKNKKEKKIKFPEVFLENKIRDVKINERQHFLLFVSMILFFNLLLLTSVAFVLIYLNIWYTWVICFILLSVSFGLSFKTFRETHVFHKCELYSNALVVNSIWFSLKVDLKDIYEMQVKESFLDKMFKLNTKSLEVKMLGYNRKKFTIHFIEENVVQLKQEITILIDKHTENKSKTKNKKEKTSA